MRQLLHLFTLITIVFICSCGNPRKLTYFNDLKDTSTIYSTIPQRPEPIVQVGDILVITVSSLNPESNQLFNRGIVPNASSTPALGGLASTGDGYLVNNDGSISFPVLGQINLLGLTRDQVRKKMVEELSTFVKDPIVSVRFNNFRITVVGEVNKPATFIVPNEKINIIEALGMAGDMTPYGKRNNVLLIREVNGQRIITRINLNNHDILNSPYYYLKQNDVIYIEPSKYRDPSNAKTLQIVSIVLSALSIITLIVTRLNIVN